jgi:redox-sensing transcriptional repressor
LPGTVSQGAEQASDPDRERSAPARRLPAVTVERLPVYLRVLRAAQRSGVAVVSSEQLAERSGLPATTVRKDLSRLGPYGTRGSGYDVGLLSARLGEALGAFVRWRLAIVGVGNLGRALANYGGLAERGFEVAALFDARPEVVGQSVAGVVVEPPERLSEVVGALGITIGVVAVPAPAAQGVVDRLAAAGVRSILNFAPVVVNAPADVVVRAVDLSTELQVLGFYELQRVAGALGDPGGEPR